jgi:hypothetical protein
MNSFTAQLRGFAVGILVFGFSTIGGFIVSSGQNKYLVREYLGSKANIQLSNEDIANSGIAIGGIIGLIAGYRRIQQTNEIIDTAEHNITGYQRIKAELYSVRDVADASKYMEIKPDYHWKWSHNYTFYEKGIPLYINTTAYIFVLCGGWTIFSWGSLAVFPVAWVISKLSESYAKSLCNTEIGIYYNNPSLLRNIHERIRAEEESAKSFDFIEKISKQQAQEDRDEAPNKYLENTEDIDSPWSQ